MDGVMSYKDALKIAMRDYREYTTVNWHGKAINIKYLLGRNEVFELMHRIADSCTVDGKIASEFIDFSVKLNVILAYVDIELPDDIDEVYKFIYHSDIYDFVVKFANKKQLDSIIDYFKP